MSEKKRDLRLDAHDEGVASDAAFNAWLDDTVRDMFARLAAAPLPRSLLERLSKPAPSAQSDS